jgi:hypothetical protein
MIVVEHSIRDIVGTMPIVRLNDSVSNKPFFGWGDKAELGRYLKLKPDVYPLIWLLPSIDNYINRGQTVNKSCELIIATRETRKEMFNDERYINSFDVILNPTTANLIQGLTKSGISTLVGGTNYGIFKFPNYSEADENYTIDLWDAVKLTIEINFNDNECLKTINYV